MRHRGGRRLRCWLMAASMLAAGLAGAQEEFPSPDAQVSSEPTSAPAETAPPADEVTEAAAEAPEDGAPQETSSAPADESAPESPEASTGDPAPEPLPVIPVESPPPPPPEPLPQEAPPQLEDIVVTATKREQSVREIPSTISALHGEDLEQIGARELTDFINLVPGITLQEGMLNNQRKLTIRGVGPGDGANQTTGQLIGDVPMTDPYAAYVIPDLDPFDLRTVEILMGPQGTVFGASALNGAIRYVPNAPELGVLSGRAFVDWLSVEEGSEGLTYGGAINVPLGESFALRGMGVVQDAPGVYDNHARGIEDADSRRKTSWRVLGRWQATDRFSADAFYLKQESEQHDLGLADNFEGRLESNDRPGESRSLVDFELANLDLRYAFDFSTVVLQTSRLAKRQDSDIDTSGVVPQLGALGIEYLRGTTLADIEGWVHELRLVAPEGGRWSWVGGVFMQDYEASLDIDQYVANSSQLGSLLDLLPSLDGLSRRNGLSIGGGAADPLAAEEQALFGEITRRFGDSFEVTLGARWYRTRLRAEMEQYGAIILIYDRRSSVTRHFDQEADGISPKLALAWHVTDGILAYANVARGFQFGGINLLPAVVPSDSIPPDYESSSLWSYEAGVRTDWLDRTLRIDLTGFHLDWTDAQIRQATPTLIQTPYIDNVGAAVSNGAETTIAWLTPIPGVSVNASASYIVAQTAAPYENGSQTVPEGTDMPAAPRLQTSTTLGWSDLVGRFSASAALTHTYQDKAWSNLFHDYEIYDYHQLNLNMSVGRPDWSGAPALTLGVTNLTDERAFLGRSGGLSDPTTGTNDGPLSGAQGRFAFYTRPRTISVRLTAQF